MPFFLPSSSYLSFSHRCSILSLSVPSPEQVSSNATRPTQPLWFHHSLVPRLGGSGPSPALLPAPPLSDPGLPFLFLAFDLCLYPHTQIQSCLLFVPRLSTPASQIPCLSASFSAFGSASLSRTPAPSSLARGSPRSARVHRRLPLRSSWPSRPPTHPPALWEVQGGAGIRGGSRGSGCGRGPLLVPALPPALSSPHPPLPSARSFPGSPAPPPSLPALRSRGRSCPGEGETGVGSREARGGRDPGWAGARIRGEEGKGGGERSGEREERAGLGP